MTKKEPKDPTSKTNKEPKTKKEKEVSKITVDPPPGLEIRFWHYIDGSVAGYVFPSKEAAHAFAGIDENGDSDCNNDMFTEGDIEEVVLRVDATGKLLPPPRSAFNDKGFLIDNYTLPAGRGRVYTYNDLRDWDWK